MSIWLVSKCVTFAVRLARRYAYDLHSRFWDLYLTKFIPFPYDNNSMAYYIIRILYVSEPEPDTETYAWNETAPEPRDNIKRANISKHIRSYVFVAWFSDLFVAIRIYSLACLYNLKANRNRFSKYFEVYMILKDDCTERSLLAIEVWSAEVETCNLILFHPPLRLSIFYRSRDQPRPGSFLKKREEPGNEVGSLPRELLSNLASSFENTPPGVGEDLHWNEGLSKQHDKTHDINDILLNHRRPNLWMSYIFWIFNRYNILK
jgi:hypothetical protein